MYVFGATTISLLVLSGLATAILATIVALFARRLFGDSFIALLLGVLLVALPEIQFGSTLFMLDIPVACFQLLAMIFLVDYFRTECLAYAVYFGLVVSLGMLTKGN